MRRDLYAAAQALHQDCGGRLMRSSNLHQTLAFLGSVPDERVDEVKKLGAHLHAESFELEFGVTGYWRHNRIVWAAPYATPPALFALVAGLRDALRQAGLRVEERAYASHITLIRDARAPSVFPPVNCDWNVGDFALVVSAAAERGVDYRVLARWPLRSGVGR